MPDLLLSDAEQTALRSLLAAEQPARSPFPDRPVLEALGRLIPCDAVGVVVADSSGCVIEGVVEPHGHTDDGPRAGTGPLPLPVGVGRWGTGTGPGPGHREQQDAVGVNQALSLGFRSGPDHVVQMWMDRRHGAFGSRDLAMLALLAPALQRLLRDRPTGTPPSTLTLQERRVLDLVGEGWSNAEIAGRMCVATSTVRKHLEHVYRKLGVTNRVAALTARQGRPPGQPETSANEGSPETFA